MRWVKKLFTISNLILAVALFTFYRSVVDLSKVYGGSAQLIRHSGIVEQKLMVSKANPSEKATWDSLRSVNIKLLNDDNIYTVSFSAPAVNTLVNAGDSVALFTKEVTSANGNLVISNGGGYEYSANANEIFQILSTKYDTPIVDYKDYMSSVRTNVWVLPVMTIVLFAWYFLRRYNITSLLSFYVGKTKVEIG